MTRPQPLKLAILLAIIAILLAIMALSSTFIITDADIFDPSMTIIWCGEPPLVTCVPTAQGTSVHNYWATLSAIPPATATATTTTMATVAVAATAQPLHTATVTPLPLPLRIWKLFFPIFGD